jgi:hypothetical protein
MKIGKIEANRRKFKNKLSTRLAAILLLKVAGVSYSSERCPDQLLSWDLRGKNWIGSKSSSESWSRVT